jgi:hypothetical protein
MEFVSKKTLKDASLKHNTTDKTIEKIKVEEIKDEIYNKDVADEFSNITIKAGKGQKIPPIVSKAEINRMIKEIERDRTKYVEYKDNIRTILLESSAKFDFLKGNKDKLKEELMNSKDIRSILTSCVYNYLEIDNEMFVLLLTIMSYYAKNKIVN